jgi:hypothetical protein
MEKSKEDLDKELVTKILNASNIIAKTSRRGGTNYVVTSPKIAEEFQRLQEDSDNKEIIENRDKVIDDLLKKDKSED